MLIEAFRVTRPVFYTCTSFASPKSKMEARGEEKKSFHVIYLLLKLAQLLRLQSFVIIGQTWRRGAPCVAHTVLFFIVSCYKKMSLLVEALSQIATARTTATSTTTILIIARVKTQENTNELFKYVNYCISQDFVERKKKLGNEKNTEKKGLIEGGKGARGGKERREEC